MQTNNNSGQIYKVCLIVPTLNPMPMWRDFLRALDQQTRSPDCVVMMDSSSSDGARELAAQSGVQVEILAEAEFNHGGTRRRAVEVFCTDSDIVIFMTQDAVLAEPRSLERIVDHFDNPEIGAVYGRQLPREGAGPIEAHGRLFNYPETTSSKRLGDRETQGIKAAFFSNSWGAYRLSALRDAGGIPPRAICSEDTYVAGKILKAGYQIVYAADALAYHSHDFSIADEFQRYFDIGVFHAEEPWVIAQFGGAGSEGWRFVKSELKYLAVNAPWRIPEALLRTGLKFTAFKLGRLHKHLPEKLVLALSSHRAYWSQSSLDPAHLPFPPKPN